MIGSLISDEQLQSLNSANFIGAVVINELTKKFTNLVDYNIYP